MSEVIELSPAAAQKQREVEYQEALRQHYAAKEAHWMERARKNAEMFAETMGERSEELRYSSTDLKPCDADTMSDAARQFYKTGGPEFIERPTMAQTSPLDNISMSEYIRRRKAGEIE
jgi:hypothetical protein